MLQTLNYNYLYSLNSWLLLNPWWLCFDWSMGCVPVIDSLWDQRILCLLPFCAIMFSLLWLCLWGQPSAELR